MALTWHLIEALARHGLDGEALAERGFPNPGPDWFGATPPEGLELATLAGLCQAIGCQPGELLGFTPETLEEQVARQLASNPLYQSFLAHQARQRADDEAR